MNLDAVFLKESPLNLLYLYIGFEVLIFFEGKTFNPKIFFAEIRTLLPRVPRPFGHPTYSRVASQNLKIIFPEQNLHELKALIMLSLIHISEPTRPY